MSQSSAKKERKKLRKMMRERGLSPASIRLMAAEAVVKNIKPKPRWVPAFVWRWLLSKVLYVIPGSK